jgi:hypothetical protein
MLQDKIRSANETGGCQPPPGIGPFDACGTKQGARSIVSESPLALVFAAEGRVECLTFRSYPVDDGTLHSLGIISTRATCSLLDLRKGLSEIMAIRFTTYKIGYQLHLLG